MIRQALRRLKNSANNSFDSFIGDYISKLTVNRIAKQAAKPTGVFILGMHRSGTSCLTGMLNRQGLYLGSVSQKNSSNKKGNQEGMALQINREIFSANRISWFRPNRVEEIPNKLRMKIERYQRRMTIDAHKSGLKRWGAKDPRMLFTLPVWSRNDITFVGTIRHPANVVASLIARNKELEDQVDFWELWFKYNSELISFYRINRFPIVNFDWEPDRYVKAVKSVARYLELEDNCEDIFFEEKLIHQTCNDDIQNPKYKSLYTELVEISEVEEESLNQERLA